MDFLFEDVAYHEMVMKGIKDKIRRSVSPNDLKWEVFELVNLVLQYCDVSDSVLNFIEQTDEIPDWRPYDRIPDTAEKVKAIIEGKPWILYIMYQVMKKDIHDTALFLSDYLVIKLMNNLQNAVQAENETMRLLDANNINIPISIVSILLKNRKPSYVAEIIYQNMITNQWKADEIIDAFIEHYIYISSKSPVEIATIADELVEPYKKAKVETVFFEHDKPSVTEACGLSQDFNENKYTVWIVDVARRIRNELKIEHSWMSEVHRALSCFKTDTERAVAITMFIMTLVSRW